ncbi:MAG: DUF3426 domain-containing protein [Bryobacteraceae bacterium]
MAANKTEGLDQAASPQHNRFSIHPAAIVVVLVLAAGVAGFLYLNRLSQQAPPAPPPLTGAARAYIHDGFLKITDSNMQAHESYLKQEVVEITGNIANTGNRVLGSVQIFCVFYDAYGQVILRERVAIVSRKMQKLAPGESKPFRLAFDNVPDSWNQAMPQMVIAAIDFA